jgi:GNAT superfamily N-acetyltransferase
MELAHLRMVLPSESELIFSFLVLAARMDEQGEPMQKALVDSALTPYWREWGREGDLGVVAVLSDSSLPVACAWTRQFSKQNPGHGFVTESVPELAIATVAGYRNRGLGLSVLNRLLSECRRRYNAISLSVRSDSPAVRLYERVGFRARPGSEKRNRIGTHSITMVVNLVNLQLI